MKRRTTFSKIIMLPKMNGAVLKISMAVNNRQQKPIGNNTHFKDIAALRLRLGPTHVKTIGFRRQRSMQHGGQYIIRGSASSRVCIG